jgi:hypothetical protein
MFLFFIVNNLDKGFCKKKKINIFAARFRKKIIFYNNGKERKQSSGYIRMY